MDDAQPRAIRYTGASERIRGDVIDGSAQTGREGGEINGGCREGAG
jgi:hypothetical protein